jgi:hypothetical protein
MSKGGFDIPLFICDNIIVETQILADNPDGVSAKELWIALMCQKLISE